MKLISWNVNGLRSAFNKGFEAYLQKEKAELICIQESKTLASQLTTEQLNPASYSLDLNAAKKKGYSGVGVYRGLDHNAPKQVAYGLGVEDFDSEGRYIVSEFPKFTLYNIYFPSGTSGEIRQEFKYRFLDHLLEHFREMPKSQRDSCIVCGDFNICHREIDIHHPKVATQRQLSGFLPEERKWMDLFCELGFVDSFRHVHGDTKDKYSWWSYRANSRAKNLGWRIDYIFVGAKLADRIVNADIQTDVLGSDHCPVSVELDL